MEQIIRHLTIFMHSEASLRIPPRIHALIVKRLLNTSIRRKYLYWLICYYNPIDEKNMNYMSEWNSNYLSVHLGRMWMGARHRFAWQILQHGTKIDNSDTPKKSIMSSGEVPTKPMMKRDE